MSNTSSPPPTQPPPSRRRSRTAVALLSLVPLGLVGYLGWSAATGGESGDSARQLMPGKPTPEQPETESPDSGAKSGGGFPGEDGRTDQEPAPKPLAGRTIVIDPGHNPHNAEHPEEIARTVGIGTSEKACDTAGAATASGYPEAKFTLDLARRVGTALEKEGAHVAFTQNGDRKYGPCVDERAEAGNEADADVAVSLHADGAPEGNRGFHVIAPAAVHAGAADTRRIAAPSRRLGTQLAQAFRHSTGSEPARYAGNGRGLDVRDDLGGLNLSKVPKVFLECGNMRDPQEARRLTDPSWRERAAEGVVNGITAFLRGKG